jgi:hypothetical protein
MSEGIRLRGEGLFQDHRGPAGWLKIIAERGGVPAWGLVRLRSDFKGKRLEVATVLD